MGYEKKWLFYFFPKNIFDFKQAVLEISLFALEDPHAIFQKLFLQINRN